MAVLSSCVSALSVFHYNHLNAHSKEDFDEMSRRIIAKIPTLVAFTYKNIRCIKKRNINFYKIGLYIKSKMHYIAILHNILFAL